MDKLRFCLFLGLLLLVQGITYADDPSGFVFVILPIVLLVLLSFVFWIWMLIDCATRPDKKFPNKGDKIVWILVILFIGVIGALIYYFLVKVKY
jgi:prolipoprotein diacylglyceryltransferase